LLLLSLLLCFALLFAQLPTAATALRVQIQTTPTTKTTTRSTAEWGIWPDFVGL